MDKEYLSEVYKKMVAARQAVEALRHQVEDDMSESFLYPQRDRLVEYFRSFEESLEMEVSFSLDEASHKQFSRHIDTDNAGMLQDLDPDWHLGEEAV